MTFSPTLSSLLVQPRTFWILVHRLAMVGSLGLAPAALHGWGKIGHWRHLVSRAGYDIGAASWWLPSRGGQIARLSSRLWRMIPWL